MSEFYDIKEPVKDALRKDLIFRLEARPPIGIILGFIGYRNKVLPLMQGLSHGTRAFIVNADGLPGFVSSFDCIKHLK